MRLPIVRALVLCAMLFGTTAVLANARRAEVAVSRQSFSAFPMALNSGDTWRAVVDPPLDKDILRVLGVDDYLSRVYYKQPVGEAVALYMGFYGSQRQGDTIHSPQNCLPGAGWEAISEGRLQMANVDGKGRDISINRYVIQKGMDRQLVLYWYHGRGRVVASEYASRALLIRDAIVSNRTDGSLVRVIVPARDMAKADALAQEFVRVIFPSLDSYLP